MCLCSVVFGLVEVGQCNMEDDDESEWGYGVIVGLDSLGVYRACVVSIVVVQTMLVVVVGVGGWGRGVRRGTSLWY